MTFKIAIVGAGPAGLTLARILISNGVTDVTIFEQEPSRESRSQGGSLDLHPRSGQAALKAAGLFKEFQKLARYDGQDRVLVDSTQKVLMDLKGLPIGRPEIDREQLRNMLLNSIPPETIKWGQKIESLQPETGTINFTSKQSVGDFDLIVGADGAWSKIRPVVTKIKPFYSGISGCELRFRGIDEKHPELSHVLGKGSYFAFGDGRCMLIQRQGNGDVKMLAAAHQPEDWLTGMGVDLEDTKRMKEVLLQEYTDFAPSLKQLIELADDDIHYWPFHMLPVGIQWRHAPGVTLIGDAAHLMTPFAGEGVNNAMADSLDLANKILRSCAPKGNLDTAVQQYEKDMFKRATPSMEKTWQNLQERFSKPDPAARAAQRNQLGVFVARMLGWVRKE